MSTLALKLVLTPLLIGIASLAGRRWGPAMSGWLVGLPFTSGPVALFLALDHGVGFAAVAAVGILAGTISQVAFCLAYSWLALRRGWAWPHTLLAGCLAYAAVTAILQQWTLSLQPVVVAVLLTLVVALRLMPRRDHPTSVATGPPPRWDIPARMVVTTAVVLLLTGLAPTLGPRLAGLLTPFPLYAATMAVFAHHLQGATAATRVLRGLLFGLFAFTGFFAVLAALVGRIGVAPAFYLATATALACQAGSLRLLRPGMAA